MTYSHIVYNQLMTLKHIGGIILKQCKENERMIELGKQKGLTQKQLSKELQLGQSMISSVERGKKDLEEIIKLN